MKVPFFIRAGFLAIFAGWHAHGASGTQEKIGDPNTSTSTVEMKTIFSHLPLMGHAPIRVVVRNDTAENLNFGLNTSSKSRGGSRDESSMDADFTFSAPKEQTSIHTLLAPICTVPGNAFAAHYGGSGTRLSIKLNGAASAGFTESNELDPKQPACAFGKDLTKGNVEKFNKDRAATVGGSSYGVEGNFASEFDADQLPEDWRALSGFVFAAFSSEEWLRLSPAVRAGVLQWVQFGGTLHLYSQSKETLPMLQVSIPNPESSGGSFGAGLVKVIDWGGKELNSQQLSSMYVLANRLVQLEASDNHLPALQGEMQQRSFAAWQVGIILVIFGILVGPVNLFYFAKAGQRHRLFFTTPIISIGASLVLIAAILLQDGTGGSGVRMAVIWLNPSTATAAVSQDQISRTGVLFSGRFTLNEPSVVSPILLPDSQWTRLKSDNFRSPSQRYNQPEPKSFAGDWFQSRSEQGQSIQTVVSTRGRLELVSTTPPTLRSSLAYPLESVFYADEKGTLWQSQGTLDTGGTVVLVKSSVQELERNEAARWFQKHPLVDPREHSLPNYFYAFASAPGADFIPTLSSIKWEHSHALVYGPVVRALVP